MMISIGLSVYVCVVFSKVSETIIAEQLIKYLTCNFDKMLCVYWKKKGT